jgi:hypothetical protein
MDYLNFSMADLSLMDSKRELFGNEETLWKGIGHPSPKMYLIMCPDYPGMEL